MSESKVGDVLCGNFVMGDLQAVECNENGYMHTISNQELINKQAEDIKLLREALNEQVKEYCDFVHSGECGGWDTDEDEVVIKSRKALAATNPDKE